MHPPTVTSNMPRLVVVHALKETVWIWRRETRSGLKICCFADSFEPGTSLQINTKTTWHWPTFNQFERTVQVSMARICRPESQQKFKRTYFILLRIHLKGSEFLKNYVDPDQILTYNPSNKAVTKQSSNKYSNSKMCGIQFCSFF
jgi:hypothetical protein